MGKHWRKVYQIDKSTDAIIQEYDSVAKAGRAVGYTAEALYRCLRGDLKTVGGFKWERVKESEPLQTD